MSERHPTPIIIEKNDEGKRLKRVPFDVQLFSEKGLQEILRIHPEILPMNIIGDEGFNDLICIGRETDAGDGCFLDNLYISPQGYLTLVETKLWKNPEFRRVVVAQIIEYASRLSRWTYSDLDRAAGIYLAKYENRPQMRLVDWVKEKVQEKSGEMIEEDDFIDAATRCLRDGTFKLLIVGEGIRQNTEELVEYLHKTPHLRFNLALVELACYQLSDDIRPLLIVPRIVAKTVEIERAVVTIELKEDLSKKIKVEVKTPAETATPEKRTRTLEVGEFYRKLEESIGQENSRRIEKFVNDLAEELALTIIYASSSVVIKYQSPTDEKLVRLLLVNIYGEIIRAGELSEWLAEHGLNPQAGENFVQDMHKIHTGFNFKKSPRGRYGYPVVKIEEVLDKLDKIKSALARFKEEAQPLSE